MCGRDLQTVTRGWSKKKKNIGPFFEPFWRICGNEWPEGGGGEMAVGAGVRGGRLLILYKGTWLKRYDTDSPLWVLLIASARIMEMSMTWRENKVLSHHIVILLLLFFHSAGMTSIACLSPSLLMFPRVTANTFFLLSLLCKSCKSEQSLASLHLQKKKMKYTPV